MENYDNYVNIIGVIFIAGLLLFVFRDYLPFVSRAKLTKAQRNDGRDKKTGKYSGQKKR